MREQAWTGSSLAPSTWSSSKGAMLRQHCRESEVAHVASASFDYPSTTHVAASTNPNALTQALVFLSIRASSDSVIVAISRNHRNYMFLVAVDRRNVSLLRADLRSYNAAGELRRDGVLPDDLVRLWPKPAPFALVELTRVVPRIRQDIDARGALPLNLRRLRRQPVSRFLLVRRRLQRFLEHWFRA